MRRGRRRGRNGSCLSFHTTVRNHLLLMMIRAGPFHEALRDKIWSVYGGYSATQLSNITHAADTPWSRICAQYQGEIPKRTDIPTDLIREYFVNLSRKKAQAQ